MALDPDVHGMKSVRSRIRVLVPPAIAVVALVSFTLGAQAAVPAKPPARPSSPPPTKVAALDQVFDLRALAPKTRDLVRKTLAGYDFDWTLLRPELKKQGRRARIAIKVTDTSSWGAVGLAWPAPIGAIEIHSGVKDPWWFRGILLHEVAHVVDFYYLEPNGLQDDVAAIYGKDWDVVWHSFNDAFTQAFSVFPAQDAAHPLDAEQVLRLRALLGGNGGIPHKKAPPLSFNDLNTRHYSGPSLPQHRDEEVPVP